MKTFDCEKAVSLFLKNGGEESKECAFVPPHDF